MKVIIYLVKVDSKLYCAVLNKSEAFSIAKNLAKKHKDAVTIWQQIQLPEQKFINRIIKSL